MSFINLHEVVGAAHVPERNLAEDRGKSEVRFGDLTSNVPFRVGMEYTPPARGTWTIAHTPMLVPGSMEIYVCPDGCLRGVVLSASEFDGMDRFAMVTVKENNLYDNNMEFLFIDGVTDILNHRAALPTTVFLYNSCIHKMLAIDMDYIYRELRKRFPTVHFVESSMDCTMRKSKINYEEACNRQIYAALDPCPIDERSINIIGNYFPLQQESELVKMLSGFGYTVRDINRLSTWEEYQKMASSAVEIYTHPLARIAAETLAARLGTKAVYAPYCWDYDSIDNALNDVANVTGTTVPDTAPLRQQTDACLDELYEKIGDFEIQIDAAATPRPLELAKLLITHGFRVTAVYADATSPEEDSTRDWLKEHFPDLKLRAIVNFRGRVNPRDEAKKAGGKLLAIGQKAAYFTGAAHFVNLIYQSGLWGYAGIQELCRRMEEACAAEQNTKELIQVKAWGCHG